MSYRPILSDPYATMRVQRERETETMIKFAETLVVGEAFTTTPQNAYAIAFSGIVSSVKHAGNYTIVETTNGGWHRIHNGQRVMVTPKRVTI